MEKLISFQRATKLSRDIFILLALFHFLVIIGIVFFNYVPSDFLWGGQIQAKEEFLKFEIISMLIAVFCVFIVLIRSESIKIPALLVFSRVVLWLLFALFLFNTIGNILAKTTFEKLFVIVTLPISFLCLRMALEPIHNT